MRYKQSDELFYEIKNICKIYWNQLIYEWGTILRLNKVFWVLSLIKSREHW